MAPPRLVDTTPETVSNDMLSEDLLEHDCINKEPGWCEALRRAVLTNTVGLGTLGLITKAVKRSALMVFLGMKMKAGLVTGLGRVRTEGAHSYGLPGEVLTARGET